MAHKKGEGSTSNGRDSNSKRLGVKLFGGQKALAGNIIIRQRGTKFHLGENTYFGNDFTIHAQVPGTVKFRRGRRDRVFVSILPFEEVAETVAKVGGTVAKPTPRAAKPVGFTPAPAVKAVSAEPAARASAPAVKVAAPVVEETIVVAAPPAVEEVVIEAAAPVVEEVVEAAAPAVEEVAEVVEAVEETVVEEVVEAITPAVEEVAEAEAELEEMAEAVTKSSNHDDLKKIEGIGPKIEELLNEDGIFTFAELASSSYERIKGILDDAGPRYKIHDPNTWMRQATLAAEGKWDELKTLQDELNGGKEA